MMRRRTLLAAALVPPVAGVAGLAAPVAHAFPARRDATGEPEPLAVPITDVNLIGAQVLTGADGVPLLCGVTTGAPAKVSTVNARTGELLFSEPLPGAGGSYATAVGQDGLVYVGTYSNSHLYRVDPWAGTVEDLGAPLAGETFLFALASGPDARLYGGTYPGTRVFSYDVRTGDVRDYGPVATGTKYARTIAVFGDALYVGTERGVHLVRLDPDTGDLRELPLPAGIEPGDPGLSVWEVNVAGDRLYARIGADIKHSTLYVLDPATETWTAELANVAGLQLPPPGQDGEVYVMHDNELTAWNPATGQVTGTGLVYPGRVWNYRGVGWVELDDPEWPGRTLTGWFWRGEVWRYNPSTGRHSVTEGSTVPGEPADVLSLTTARDGTILAGGFLAGLARVDPADASVEFHRFSQTESLLDDGESVWIGAYPDARGYRYDPDLPWNSPEYSPGPPGAAENPAKVWDLHDAVDPQDRVFAIARVGDRVVAATGPRGPLFGGALVVHHTGSGESSVRSAGLGELTTCDLAVIGDVVYGGTWIQGGSGAPEPPLTEGDVYAYDPVADRVLWRSRPVPGATGYVAVVADRGGRLWVLGDTTLAEIDPVDGSALRTIRLGDTLGGGRTFPNSVAILREAPDAPLLYAKSANRLWRVWTDTGAVEDLGLTGYGLFTVLPDGTLALARDEQVFHWRPPAYDRSRPTVSIELVDTPGRRLPSVAVEVADTGGSGMRRVRYRIDRGPWTDYTGPVPLSRPGLHRVRAVAVDGAGNRTEVARPVLARPRR
ncbi:OmpL47-type beta-barrel domain-containing protein [Actinophytocola gossypii]|uniref:PQQ-binding-like beta-propeller repeat protein n=1 Tax=Actinophytocola gossypii TaxID=2812003 RepID=A0ABT2JGA6_9PSEU|nr:PQQ-binding-like beta-propeller repeat protein [Actinophytocola gossypii]MCT2586912.1 PQQ-binding-like beta-propeller repeat protein [Actinophytocola gossypii]